MNEERSWHAVQVIGSLIAAALLVVVTVALVTAKIGPGLDGQEQRDRYERQEERTEELQELHQERREERAERREERSER